MIMWGKNTQQPPFQAGVGETTYIAADCEFSGTIKLKGNARIDGQIEGIINLSGDLIIGPTAVIKATVEANNVSVSGKVNGDITARESLELCSSARLTGDICTQQLKVDQGAQFIGSSRLLEDEPANPFENDSLDEAVGQAGENTVSLEKATQFFKGSKSKNRR
jgi:cytoskeletal protein CcmA (bactofilin family)